MELEQTPLHGRRILVFAAHPDDIEFGMAGSVAVWTDAGAHVTYCLVTDGAAGSNEKDADLAGLIAQRQQEQIDAARVVGVNDVIFLGYADGTLTHTLELRRDLTRVVRQVRPDRVVIMDPTIVMLQDENVNYINHPDHRAAGEAALYATFPSAETRPIFPELLAEGLEPHHVKELYVNFSDKPNTAVDISGVLDRKIEALLCHRSQLDEEVTELIRQWAAGDGARVGVQYAELFRVLRFEEDGRPMPDNKSTAETDAAILE